MIEYVFIDMDNTIAENTTCDNVDFYEGLYAKKRPIKIVLDGIRELYKDSEFVIITKTDGGSYGSMEKVLWLSKYFPEVKNIIIIRPEERKSKYIKDFIEKEGIDRSKCLLIDDKKSILQDCKKIGINVKYPQQVICDYEELLLQKENGFSYKKKM